MRTHIFSAKNIRILCIESAKTVNEMTLNELVKLTMLRTTGPRALDKSVIQILCIQCIFFLFFHKMGSLEVLQMSTHKMIFMEKKEKYQYSFVKISWVYDLILYFYSTQSWQFIHGFCGRTTSQWYTCWRHTPKWHCCGVWEEWLHVAGKQLKSLTIRITKTSLYNVDPLKPHFYIVKLGFTGVYIIFLFLLKI